MPIDLTRRADLTTPEELDPGITLTQAWFGLGPPRLEVCEISAGDDPPARVMRRAWERRRGGRAVPVVVVTRCPTGLRMCGPEGAPPPVVELPEAAALDLLREALNLQPQDVVSVVLSRFSLVQGAGGVAGLRNRQLLSTHFLTDVLPARQPELWTALQSKGERLRDAHGRALIVGLGFRITESQPRELLLHADEQLIAIAHLYPTGTNLDRIAAGSGAPPAARLVARARALGVSRGLLVSGRVLRLYLTRLHEDFEEASAPAAFLEVETHVLPDDRLGLVWGCFSVEALVPGGTLDLLVEDSSRFAVTLRDRFRDRVYERVVPRLIRGLWRSATGRGAEIAPDLLYRATLALLYRLLFVLYAEDRNLLPLENPYYRQRSLTARLSQVRATVETPGRAFDKRATDLWEDLRAIFGAIAEGHREWGIPLYDGGLFKDGDGAPPEGRLLARITLPNAVVGQALYDLAIDGDAEGSGKVDFGDLGVRHLGTVYEGLLSYQVTIADTDLAIDATNAAEPYVPATHGAEVKVRAGEPYVQSPQGTRKATGSYYTPAFAVTRLVAAAVGPTVDRHLAALRGLPEDEAGSLLLDLRICDPAMGSGHFLVAALDLITERLSEFLTERRLPTVVAEVQRARDQITTSGRAYGAEGLGERISDIDLLRRLVLKRCIYGVDLNPMAVELAQLSLWLHAFVPGLPLSYLGHTLRCGNSLVGVAGRELEEALEHSGGLFASAVTDSLTAALDDARAIGSITDLELREVEESEARQAKLEKDTEGVRTVYDLYTAAPFDGDGVGRDQLFLGTDLRAILGGQIPSTWTEAIGRADALLTEHRAFHWQLSFPEVFLRGRPGFDAIVGNPPWEEVTVEELGFYVRYLPGLKSERSEVERRRRMEGYEETHLEVREMFEMASHHAAELRAYLAARYELTRSGDPDLYRAFAERFLQLCREGGALGVVMPRSAMATDGTAPLRQRLFGASDHVQLDFITNRGQWLFAAVHPQYTIALVVAHPSSAAHDAVISTAGPVDDRTGFDRLDSERIEWRSSELARLSPGLEVPLIPSARAGALFRRLCAAHPPFRSGDGGFRPLPWTELHMTNDRKSGLLRESGPGWPVWSGDSFDLWKPDHLPPPFVLPEQEGLRHLQQKRQRSRIWTQNFLPTVVRDANTMPQHRARILFRDVSRATDSRTVRACLAPPRIFAVNTAPSILFPRGDQLDEAYVLGVMCSMPFDWLARRRVETHLNFFMLDGLPLPRPTPEDPRRQRVVSLAGRLACVDERYRDFASAVGIDCGPVDPAEKSEMIAELDAMVGSLYGLVEDDVSLMFDDFPATVAGISAERRARVLDHLAQLGKLA